MAANESDAADTTTTTTPYPLKGSCELLDDLVRKHKVARGDRRALAGLIARQNESTHTRRQVRVGIDAVVHLRQEAAAMSKRCETRGGVLAVVARRISVMASSVLMLPMVEPLLAHVKLLLSGSDPLLPLAALGATYRAWWVQHFGLQPFAQADHFIHAWGLSVGCFLPHLLHQDPERAVLSLATNTGLTTHVSTYDAAHFFAVFGVAPPTTASQRHPLTEVSEVLSLGLFENRFFVEQTLHGAEVGAHCVTYGDTPGTLLLWISRGGGGITSHAIAKGRDGRYATNVDGLKAVGRSLLETVELTEPLVLPQHRSGAAFALPWADPRGGVALWGTVHEAEEVRADDILSDINLKLQTFAGIAGPKRLNAEQIKNFVPKPEC